MNVIMKIGPPNFRVSLGLGAIVPKNETIVSYYKTFFLSRKIVCLAKPIHFVGLRS